MLFEQHISGLGSPSIGSVVITASQVTDLLAGWWCTNVHAVLNPPDEIQGQARYLSFALLSLGLFGQAFYGRPFAR